MHVHRLHERGGPFYWTIKPYKMLFLKSYYEGTFNDCLDWIANKLKEEEKDAMEPALLKQMDLFNENET